MDEQEHKQLHKDIKGLKEVGEKIKHSQGSGRYSGLFYASIGLISVYFFDGILASVVALGLGALWFSIMAGVFLKLRISAGRFITIALFEGAGSVCCSLVIDYGLHHNASYFYSFISAAFIYLVYSDLVKPVLLFALSVGKSN